MVFIARPQQGLLPDTPIAGRDTQAVAETAGLPPTPEPEETDERDSAAVVARLRTDAETWPMHLCSPTWREAADRIQDADAIMNAAADHIEAMENIEAVLSQRIAKLEAHDDQLQQQYAFLAAMTQKANDRCAKLETVYEAARRIRDTHLSPALRAAIAAADSA